jgi:hypothetical protein
VLLVCDIKEWKVRLQSWISWATSGRRHFVIDGHIMIGKFLLYCKAGVSLLHHHLVSIVEIVPGGGGVFSLVVPPINPISVVAFRCMGHHFAFTNATETLFCTPAPRSSEEVSGISRSHFSQYLETSGHLRECWTGTKTGGKKKPGESTHFSQRRSTMAFSDNMNSLYETARTHWKSTMESNGNLKQVSLPWEGYNLEELQTLRVLHNPKTKVPVLRVLAGPQK